MAGERGVRADDITTTSVLRVVAMLLPATILSTSVQAQSASGVGKEDQASTMRATAEPRLRTSLQRAKAARARYAGELEALKRAREAEESRQQLDGQSLFGGALIGTRIGTTAQSGVEVETSNATNVEARASVPGGAKDAYAEMARLKAQLAATELEITGLLAQIDRQRRQPGGAYSLVDPQDQLGNASINQHMSDLNDHQAMQDAKYMRMLEERGAALARRDPLANALRHQQPVGEARRGFDFGMALAEGQTLPGPGKQKFHDALSVAGQGGFTAAVSYSLARNRQKLTDLAPKGAAIASQDPMAMELRSQQPEGPARLGFDIGMAASEGHTSPGPGKQRIHDALYPAERPGFSAAVSFSLARNRQKLVELAPRGQALADQDPLANQLREQQPEGPVRLGFDIGMAAAEGQTGPGPGKQRMQDSLYAAEQPGFATAVRFSIDRNRNAARAATGAAIAQADPVVAERRNAETDVFYRLGFDIATAIFGDPALGAQGNTATGPGSLAIRDSLGAAGQRGFNAAVALHLDRSAVR